jgi:hypothetical protein|tara:strand:- start:1163 stop:1342 length:180 start_codon:yes stop_codon:yes gene_type:complete
MSKNTIPIEFDKASIKMLLNTLDKYQESHPLGSPVEKDNFSDIYKKLKIALFELTFMDG